MKTASANVHDLARETVSLELARFGARIKRLLQDYRDLGKLEGTRPDLFKIHTLEAEAVVELCAQLSR